MSGFANDGAVPVPHWLTERFDSTTRLPLGPLEYLPLPLEGQITNANSCVPTGGEPPSWHVGATCNEPIAEAVRFYEEYLPLAGYEIVASGVIGSRRSDGNKHADHLELMVLRRGIFVGTLSLFANPSGECSIEVDMAHVDHPQSAAIANRRAVSYMKHVRWRKRP